MIVVKHQPKSPQAKAEQMARTVAKQCADDVFTDMIGKLPLGSETAIEACRRLNRLTAAYIAANGDAGRAMGVLGGSAAMIQPAYRTEKQSAAEALFARPVEGEK